MKLSVIVPVYNVEKYLEQCVNSILNQTYTDFELILVDDGSPDGCPRICDAYCRQDGRVKVIHKENGGLTSARKAGLTIAAGEYIVVADSDDWVEADLLGNLDRAIEKSGSDVICFNYYLVGEITECKKHKYAQGVYTGEALDGIRRDYLYDAGVPGMNDGALPYSICVKAIRRELYEACQSLVPDEIVKGEDLLFTLYLLERCRSVCMLDYVGYYYRMNCDSITHRYNKSDIGALHRLTELILQASPGSGEAYRNQAYAYAFRTFWDLILGIAGQTESQKEFVDFLKKEYHPDFVRYFRGLRIAKPAPADRLKLFLVRNRMWKQIYAHGKRLRK